MSGGVLLGAGGAPEDDAAGAAAPPAEDDRLVIPDDALETARRALRQLSVLADLAAKSGGMMIPERAEALIGAQAMSLEVLTAAAQLAQAEALAAIHNRLVEIGSLLETGVIRVDDGSQS